MKTTTIRYRKVDSPHGIRCIGASMLEPCEREATWCREWETTGMSGPAFWYACDEHAAAMAEADGITLD